MECKNCLMINDKYVIHTKDEICNIACSNIICRRCYMKGHFATHCVSKKNSVYTIEIQNDNIWIRIKMKKLGLDVSIDIESNIIRLTDYACEKGYKIKFR